MTRRIFAFFMALATICFASLVRAEDYPSRLITIEAPYSPGSSVDIMARMIADRLHQQFDQTVIVEIMPAPAVRLG